MKLQKQPKVMEAKEFNRCKICEAEKAKRQTYSKATIYLNGVELTDAYDVVIEES